MVILPANSQKAYNFSDDQITRMRESARRLDKFPDEHFDNQLAALEETGCVGVNGIGSIISYSHLEDSEGVWKKSFREKFPALAEKSPDEISKVHQSMMQGYRRAFCCKDTFYRGTPENPGITVGLQKVEGENTFGGYLETDLKKLGLDEEQATQFMCLYYDEFANREIPPNMPIYKFVLEEVKIAGGQTRLALCCVADEDGPLYDGNLSLDEITDILAVSRGAGLNAQGMPKPRGYVTGLDYLKALMVDSQKYGILVEDHLVETLLVATAKRLGLPMDKQLELSRLEPSGPGANTITANAAFGVNAAAYTAERKSELEAVIITAEAA